MLSSILGKAPLGKESSKAPGKMPGKAAGGRPGGNVADKAAIIDSARLRRDLAALSARGDRNAQELRSGVLSCLRDVLASGHDEVERRFLAQRPGERIGEKTVRSLAFLIDELVRALADFAAGTAYPSANPTLGEQLAVVAVGGYGRGELAPQSDVDLLFLLPYKQTPRGEQIVEYMLYMLWDMGLKVGHATRSVDECLRQARDDVTIRTALLDSLLICGNEALH